MPSKESTDISDILKDISKKYGLTAGSMSDVTEKVEGLTTGNLVIDYLTGVGGLPVGRVTELYGQPSSGKTTTALQAAAKLQQRLIDEGRDEHILYLDYEHALDPAYCADLGLDVDNPTFIVIQPNWLEQGANAAEKLTRTGKVRMSIWDSVAEMTPEDAEFGVRTNAMDRARLMNSLLQRQVSILHENRCAGVFLNHMVEAVTMGGRPGMPPQETSPGGKALKFYASVRLAYKQIKPIKGKRYDPLTGGTTEQVVGMDVKVKVTKNKIGIAHREANVRVRLGQGFDEFWSALQILVAHNAITTTTTGHHYFDAQAPAHPDMPTSTKGSRPVLHGEPALLKFADEHPQWRENVIGCARDVIEQEGADKVLAAIEDDELAVPISSLLDD